MALLTLVDAAPSTRVLSSDLSVIEMDPWKDPRWETFVLRHPESTVYHHPAWLQVLQREYRQPGVYLGCEERDGTLRGIFPLLYTRGLPFRGRHPLVGSRLCSLPRTPGGGPLGVDQKALSMLVYEAQKRASARSSLRLQIKTQTEQLSEGIEGITREAWRQKYVVYLAGQVGQPYRIPGSQDRSSVKRAINKAIASGVCTRPAETEDELRTWYQIYLETMRRNFVPARPYRLFRAMWDLMRPRQMMRLLLAEHKTKFNSRIIGGHLFFFFGGTVTYAFGASRAEDFSLRPNDIIMEQAINDASKAGFRFVDLGEVPEGDYNLARFKAKWGAAPVRMCRFYFPELRDTRPYCDETEDYAGIHAQKIWNHVPLVITSWLGDYIYAHL